MTIEQYIKERSEYAVFVAEDGAFLMAAKVLEDLAKEVKAHGMAMQHGVGKPFTAPRAS